MNEAHSSAPDGTMVRAALLRFLRELALDVPQDRITVRLTTYDRSPGRLRYTIIAYPPASAALSELMQGVTGCTDQELVGIWVLTDLEAAQLCARGSEASSSE